MSDAQEYSDCFTIAPREADDGEIHGGNLISVTRDGEP